MAGIWWGRRAATSPPGAHDVLVIPGDEHPDGTLVDLDGDPPRPPIVTARVDSAGRITQVDVAPELAGPAPALWYVEAPEIAANPPAMVLIAYSTRDLADGTVVDNATFTAMPVASDVQVAAIRWWPANGQIHQIYVGPGHRRQGIGRKLFAAAAGYVAGRGWPRLWVSGERTDLGEAALRHAPDYFAGRVTPRHTHSPPM
jgi:GNAT superfamily N-acetyltransferase